MKAGDWVRMIHAEEFMDEDHMVGHIGVVIEAECTAYNKDDEPVPEVYVKFPTMPTSHDERNDHWLYEWQVEQITDEEEIALYILSN